MQAIVTSRFCLWNLISLIFTIWKSQISKIYICVTYYLPKHFQPKIGKWEKCGSFGIFFGKTGVSSDFLDSSIKIGVSYSLIYRIYRIDIYSFESLQKPWTSYFTFYFLGGNKAEHRAKISCIYLFIFFQFSKLNSNISPSSNLVKVSVFWKCS